ncbi:hypothetical protein ACW9UR_21000 [Halovulum sp. GXIMD14794]
MKFFDLQNPIFIPLWRRILVVALAGGWAVVEFLSGNPLWGALFAAAAAWCAWSFFVIFDPPSDEDASAD